MADQPVVDRFRAWMAERQLPLTPQRLAIAGRLLGSDRHLSAEELVESLAGSGVKVGTATVYRTIDMLLEGGFIAERNRGEGFRRFEPKRDLPHFEQMLCTKCGRVEEFSDAALERMTNRIAESHAFMREKHRLVIYGRCAECQRGSASAGARA